MTVLMTTIWEVFCKKAIPKNFVNLQENPCDGVPLSFTKFLGVAFSKKPVNNYFCPDLTIKTSLRRH